MDKGFLHFLLIEPFKDGIIGRLIGLLIWVSILFFTYFIIYLSFKIIDSSCLSIKTDNAIVIDKYYKEPYTTTSFIMVGKVTVPNIRRHSESYNVKVEINKKFPFTIVTKEIYDSININDIIKCEYANARFSDEIYIKKIFLLN